MAIKEVIVFTIQNWEVIVGLVLFLVHMLMRWGVIQNEHITQLYNEAIAFGNQVKKNSGKDGLELSGTQVKDLVLDYLDHRVPMFHKVDTDKVEGLLNLQNKSCVIPTVEVKNG